MKWILPLWHGIRAEWLGWKLRNLNPMAPQLMELVVEKNRAEKGPY